MRFRWLILICGVVLILVAWLKGEIVDAVIAFCLGMAIGLPIDWLGMRVLRFWDYPRQPFLHWKYLVIALPDWGVIMMMINLLWNWIETPWLAFLVVVVALFITHDLPNLKTKSWHYYVPMWFAVTGWLGFILLSRFVFVALR